MDNYMNDVECLFCRELKDNNDFGSKISKLSVSTLWLNKDQTYKGHSILIFNNRHATGLEKLNPKEYDFFMKDLHRAMHAVGEVVKPNLMNYASLGNVEPHLHLHIIPRYVNDPRWGQAIWTTTPAEMQRTLIAQEEFEELRLNIKKRLEAL